MNGTACGMGCACSNCTLRARLDCEAALATLPATARGGVVAALVLENETSRSQAFAVRSVRSCEHCGGLLDRDARLDARYHPLCRPRAWRARRTLTR
jgi:hypothetical protein